MKTNHTSLTRWFAGLTLFTLLAAMPAGAVSTTRTWNGGGADNNWFTTLNWGATGVPVTTDIIQFCGNTRLAPNNDISTLTINAINFTNDNSSGYTGVFNLAGNSITLGGSITMTAPTTGLPVTLTDTISLNMILSGNRTIVNASTGSGATLAEHDLNIAGTISDSPAGKSLTVQHGVSTLTGPNTFSGPVLVNQNGTLVVNSIADSGTSALGLGTSLTLGAGAAQSGTLIYNSTGTTAATTSRGVTLGGTGAGASSTINNNSPNPGATLTFTGIFTNLGTGGTKTFTLGGSNTGANTFQSVISNGVTGGSIALAKADAGRWILTGANTYSGGTTITAGELDINYGGSSSANSAIGTGTLNINGGTIDNTSAGTVTLQPNNSVSLGNGGFTYGGTKDLNLGTGAVTLALPAANGTTIYTLAGTERTLTLGGTVTENAILGTTTIQVDGAGNNLVLGSLVLNANGTARINQWQGSANVTVNGGIAPGGNSAHKFTYAGSGSFTIGGASTYTGITTISSGTLLVNGDNSAATGAVTLSGGTLGGSGTIGGAVTQTGGTLTAKSIGTVGTLTLTNGLTLTPGSGSTILNVDLTNATTAGVTYDQIAISSGALTVNAGNNFVQFTTPSGYITNGVYTLMTYPSRSGSPITFVDGSTNIANNFILTNGPTSLVLYVATTGLVPVSLKWQGVSSGTWDISTANWTNTITGGPDTTYVDGSVVTFDDTAASFTVTNIAGSSGYSPAGVTFNNSANNYNVSATINGAGGVTKNGTGTVTLSGTNTFTGLTTINQGVLNIQNNAALGSTNGATTVASNARLQLQGGITVGENITFYGTGLNLGAVRSISGNNTLSGTLTNATGTSRINCDADTLTITNLTNPSGNNFALTLGGAGNINFGGPLNIGIGNLTKDGAGALTLGASNKLNQTFLNAGTLNLNHVRAISAANLNIADGTTLDNTSGGPIVLAASCNPIINGNFTFTGTYDLNLGTGPVTLTNGSRTITTVAGTLTLGGAISDNGYANSLTKTGNGTLVLGGTNTYGGNTVINAGTLALGANGRVTNSASIVVASNAIFNVSARSTPFTLASGLSSQTLSNSAPGAIINGTNDCSTGTISLVYDGVNPSFILTNGTMTLSNTTTFKINNTGTQLGAGNHTIITNATAGNVGLVAGTLPAVTVNGGGTTGSASLQINLNGGLDLVVSSGGLPATGTNITFSVSSGALTLTWPQSYLGWYAQSNSLDLANTNDWYDIGGSQLATNLVITLDPSQTNVFYRMRHP